MNTLDWLSRIRIDWSNFEEARKISGDIVRELAATRSLLRRLVLLGQRNEVLRPLAEKHGELNYIVLYDALERGLRIRLHRFTKGMEDIPHNHRFSFSSAVLRGSYVHTLFRVNRMADNRAKCASWTLDQPRDIHLGIALDRMRVVGLTPQFETTQAEGSSYTLHHSTVHKTAMPFENAYSLFCRGPAAKPCALQLQPELKSYRWKFGREHETDEAVASRKMTDQEFRSYIEGLEEADVI